MMCIFSACSKKEGNFASSSTEISTTEAPNAMTDEIKSLLNLGKYDDVIELDGERDSRLLTKKDQKFLFPKCKILSVSYSTFSEDSTFLSLSKEEVLQLISLIENSSILKDGDSLSNYGVRDDTQEKYAKLCIVYENAHGELQNVWLHTFKGNVLHFYDFQGEDYRIGSNKELVDFVIEHVGYRVLSAENFDKIDRVTVEYDNEEYDLSADKTAEFIKAMKKLAKRQDEFHDYNLTAVAYTSDGDVYHIKTSLGEHSENEIAVEGACYGDAEAVIQILENH